MLDDRRTAAGRIVIRPFTVGDAEDCFRIRTEAFVLKFYPELEPEVVAAGINAYMPSDYMRMGEALHCFVAADGDDVVGFYVARAIDPSTLELILLYVKADYAGQGLGSLLLDHLEGWLRSTHPDIRRIVLDTIVPGYNGKFYEKKGFTRKGDSELCYPGRKVKATRMAKKLKKD